MPRSPSYFGRTTPLPADRTLRYRARPPVEVEMRRVAAQKGETARTGLEYYELHGETWKRMIDNVPTDCDWHPHVAYTTSGICNGPRCVAYAEAHADDFD